MLILFCVFSCGESSLSYRANTLIFLLLTVLFTLRCDDHDFIDALLDLPDVMRFRSVRAAMSRSVSLMSVSLCLLRFKCVIACARYYGTSLLYDEPFIGLCVEFRFSFSSYVFLFIGGALLVFLPYACFCEMWILEALCLSATFEMLFSFKILNVFYFQ